MSIKLLIETIEKKKPLPECSVFDAIQMLEVAWGKVTTKAVVNCLEKAVILKEKQSEALLDADDPFKDLQEQLDKLAVYNPSSSQKEPPLMISSLLMILSPALSR